MIPISYVSTASGATPSTISGASVTTPSTISGATVTTPSNAAPLNAPPSTVSGAEMIPVNYITISGPLPDTPYDMIDDVILKTEAELKKMDVSSLMLLGSTLSTSIALETSTLITNQQILGIYSVLKQLSQSTIDGLDTETSLNTSLIDSYTQYEAYLDGVSTAYISTMNEYDRELADLLKMINEYNSSLSSYTTDYDVSVSSLEKENNDFVISAVNYSSLYYTYLGYQVQYISSADGLSIIDNELSSIMLKEEASYRALQESTMRWSSLSGILSSLYTDRTNIGSTLRQYRIEESEASLNYASTSAAYSTISSIYAASVANEIYAQALSTATQKETDYANALEQFQAADLIYTDSIPQGTTPVLSGPVQGNSALWAARSMSEQLLQKTRAEKIAAENATATLLNLAGLANTSAYDAMLLGYDALIYEYAKSEMNFKNYKLSSLEQVARFSSIYDQSIIDINNYSEQFSTYSSFYLSSMIGASTLLGYSEIDASTIAGDLFLYNALSWSIKSLTEQYNISVSSYESTITASTLYAYQYASTMSNVDMYTRYYNSTKTAVDRLTDELYGSGALLTIYNNTIFTNSSILNREILNSKIYDTQVKGFINLQDESMYEYRETYCRSQREFYQYNYESNVFVAVQLAQNITASNQSRAAPGTTVTPIAADLTVPAVSNSYSLLKSINTFLTSFGDIYMTFDNQANNVNNLSTSIANEGAALSTVDFYTKAQYFGTPVINNIGKFITNSCGDLANAQNSTTTLLTTFGATQSMIDEKKVKLLSSLKQYFSPGDLVNQETTISSFLIQSIAEANTILASQGITVTVV